MINTGKYKMYGQMEDIANGNADVEEFVYRNGEIVRTNEVEDDTLPVVRTAREKNYALPEGRDVTNFNVKLCNRTFAE